MKVLIALESAEIFYHYRSVIAALASRGHAVKVFFAKGTDPAKLRPASSFDAVLECARQYTTFAYGGEPYEPNRRLRSVVFPARAVANYRRFLKLKTIPSFYRDRYRKLLPGWLKPFVALPLLNVNAFIRSDLCGKIIAGIEDRTPPDQRIIANIKGFNPDVVVVSSGNVVSSSPDFEYLRAARSLGIPNVLLAASWDYLETKGFIHVKPDALFVWNNTHRQEAIRSHGILSSTIQIVGAPLFDNFFGDLKPSEPRAAFCARYGLQAEDPIILYIGSSGIFGSEARFLQSVREAFDASPDPRMRRVQIIVRPHPITRGSRNYAKMIAGMRGAVCIPQFGELPSTRAALQLFYDTFHHSAAVLSIGSSGFINALIVGKPSATVLVPYYRQIQAEAPHFKHLLQSGAVASPKDFAEIPRFVARVEAGSKEGERERNQFIEQYIRPRGRAYPAGEVVADKLENVVQSRTV